MLHADFIRFLNSFQPIPINPFPWMPPHQQIMGPSPPSSPQLTSNVQYRNNSFPKRYSTFSIDALLSKDDKSESVSKKTEYRRPAPYPQIPASESHLKTTSNYCPSNNNQLPGGGKASKSKRIRTIFSQAQLEKLESEFKNQQYMVGPERVYLAQSLDLTEAQVKVWFQNRRIKWRKQYILPANYPTEANNNDSDSSLEGHQSKEQKSEGDSRSSSPNSTGSSSPPPSPDSHQNTSTNVAPVNFSVPYHHNSNMLLGDSLLSVRQQLLNAHNCVSESSAV